MKGKSYFETSSTSFNSTNISKFGSMGLAWCLASRTRLKVPPKFGDLKSFGCPSGCGKTILDWYLKLLANIWLIQSLMNVKDYNKPCWLHRFDRYSWPYSVVSIFCCHIVQMNPMFEWENEIEKWLIGFVLTCCKM